MAEGWICIHRKMLNWEWYDEPNTAHLFLYCLLRANYEDTEWRGTTIKRGSFITSLAKISQDTGLTIQQVRTSLNRLKSTNEITNISTNRNRLITVKNYNLYQDDNKRFNKQLTNEQQTNNKQLTTDNKDNNINNITSNVSTNRFIDLSLSKEEREILKKIIKKNMPNVKNINAYARKLLDNGDYLQILKDEKAKIERQKAKEDIPPAEELEQCTPEEAEAGLEKLARALKIKRRS